MRNAKLRERAGTQSNDDLTTCHGHWRFIVPLKDTHVDLEAGHGHSWFSSNFFQSGFNRFRHSRYSTRSSDRRSLSRRRTTLVTTRASPKPQRRESENNSDPASKRPSVGSIGRLSTMAAGLPERPSFPVQRSAVSRRLFRGRSVDYAVDPPLAQTEKSLLYKNTGKRCEQ